MQFAENGIIIGKRGGGTFTSSAIEYVFPERNTFSSDRPALRRRAAVFL